MLNKQQIVPVVLSDEKKSTRKYVKITRTKGSEPAGHLKVGNLEVTLYNKADEHILDSVLTEVGKYVD